MPQSVDDFSSWPSSAEPAWAASEGTADGVHENGQTSNYALAIHSTILCVMKIISGGQTGVDRAALDVAIERGMEWGGWCPKGGWAEDFTNPPGLLGKYPHLTETPLPHPQQRTEWNVRDSDAALIITDSHGLLVSIGPQRADRWAHRHGTPELVVEVDNAKASVDAANWLLDQRKRFGPCMSLNIGGPRESESPGIYAKAKLLIALILDHVT